jgi:hypothetical protein
MNSLPCSARSRPATSVKPRPSSSCHVPPLGLGRDRPGHQTAADDRRRRVHLGHGAIPGPPGLGGTGSRLYAVVSDRRVQRVYHRLADAFRPAGPAAAPPGHRPRAQAPLDAAARAALCAGGQTVSAPTRGPRVPPRHFSPSYTSRTRPRPANGAEPGTARHRSGVDQPERRECRAQGEEDLGQVAAPAQRQPPATRRNRQAR